MSQVPWHLEVPTVALPSNAKIPPVSIPVSFATYVLSQYKPPEIHGAEWVGNSPKPNPDAALADYRGLIRWQTCYNDCLFARSFKIGDIRWAIYNDINMATYKKNTQ